MNGLKSLLLAREKSPVDVKIVFTNGCFDLIHPGHLHYLENAKNLGTHLVVGLNSDESIRQLKGPDRPINNFDFRSRILSALACVDIVIGFQEPTPYKLIENVQPDVLVKGGDYNLADIVGAEQVLSRGGEVRVLDFLPGHSSSAIIEKIKRIAL